MLGTPGHSPDHIAEPVPVPPHTPHLSSVTVWTVQWVVMEITCIRCNVLVYFNYAHASGPLFFSLSVLLPLNVRHCLSY